MKSGIPAGLALAGLGILNVYRAITQSFTIDEAFCYLQFTSFPLVESFTKPYDAAHHVLFTILSRVSEKLLGNSEIALRLPAVLAGVAMLALIWFWARRLSGGTWIALPYALLVASQPLLVDHMSAARGYGLAAVLWMAGFLLVCRSLGAGAGKRSTLLWAGACFGLSVSANLMFLVPLAGLLAVFVWLQTPTWARFAEAFERVGQLAVMATLVAFALLLAPLAQSGRDNFYFGSGSVEGAITSVLVSSVPQSPVALVRITGGYLRLFLLVSLAGAAVYFVLALVRRRRLAAAGAPASALICGTTVVTAGLTLAAHKIGNVPYPFGRTALPLLILILMSACALARESAAIPFLKPAWTLCLCAAALCHLAALRTDRYAEWDFDADTRLVATHARDLLRATHTPTRLCASPTLEPAVDYYLKRFSAQLPTVTRNGYGEACDVVMLLSDDPNRAKEPGRPVFTGPIAHTTLYDRRRQ
jgi:hypothetical protein